MSVMKIDVTDGKP